MKGTFELLVVCPAPSEREVEDGVCDIAVPSVAALLLLLQSSPKSPREPVGVTGVTLASPLSPGRAPLTSPSLTKVNVGARGVSDGVFSIAPVL